VSYSFWFVMTTCLAPGLSDNATPPGQIAISPTPVVSDCSSCGCAEEHCGFLARLKCRLGMHSCEDCCGSCSPCNTPAPCNCHCGLTLRERLARLFHRSCCSNNDCGCCAQGCTQCTQAPALAPTPPPPPRPMPAPPKPVTVAPARPSMEISKEYLDRVANASDYSWVTGQLFYIHADSGLWVVRYAPVDKEDRYGGSVVLAPALNMDSFHEGDLVTIHGEVLNEGRATKYLGGPLYRTLAVNLEDRKASE